MASTLPPRAYLNQAKAGEPEYLNSAEASALLRISRSTLYKKVKNIPHSKPGKGLLFKRSVLLQIIEDARVPTDDELYEKTI